jgi:hypothetical protein
MNTPVNNNNLMPGAQNIGVPSAAMNASLDKLKAPSSPKKENFFVRLSKREQIMIIVLAILIVGAALVYFAIVPAVKNYNTITNEIEDLREQETQMRLDISQLPIYKEQFDVAKERYDKALLKYNSPMAPELLDETITSLIAEAGFEPSSLTMSPLASEAISPYTTTELQANDVPVLDPLDPLAPLAPEGEQAEEPQGDPVDPGVEPEGEVSPDAEGGASADTGSGEYSSYVYSLDITVDGTYTNLLNLLTSVRTVNGLYLTTYSYDAKASEVILGNASNKKGTQQFALTFKLYVFVG